MTGIRAQSALELKNNAGVPYRSYSQDGFDTNTLANYDQLADTATTWSIASSRLTAAAGGVQSVLTYFGYVAQDTYIDVVVSQARDAGLVLRFGDNNNYYLLTLNDSGASSGANTVTFFKRVAGAFTSLGTFPVVWPTGTFRRIRFQAVGAQLSAFMEGVLIGVAYDTTFQQPGRIGLRANTNVSFFEELRWAPSDVPAYDPYWNNVVSLMNFEGVAGATTFVDERTHALGWTRVGTGIANAVVKMFGGSSYQSTLINGVGGTYLRATDAGPEWDSGAADFTVEGWAYADTTAVGILCCQRDPAASSSADRGISVFCNGDGILRASMGSSNGVGSANVSGTLPGNNAWFHWAYTRQGTTFRLFINGLMVGSVTSSASPANGFGMTLGGDPSGTGTLSWRGYIDSFRYTVGVCRYTQTFYTPAVPFGTGNAPWEQKPVPRVASLLRFNGANNFGGPFFDETGKSWVGTGAASAYLSPIVHRFGQTGLICQTYANAYIETPSTTDFAFGTGAWTIESWVQFLTNVSDNRTKWIFDFRDTGAATSGLAIGVNGNGFLQVIYNNVTYGATGANLGTFAWRHMQVCYDGKTLYAFIDGALQWSVTVQIFMPAAKLRMGGDTGGTLGFQGNFDETRVLGNVCNNIATFVRPESPFFFEAIPYDPFLASVATLMNFSGVNNATPAQEDKGKALTFTGNAALATTNMPGNTSLAAVRLDGAGDYVTIPNGSALGSNDFKYSLGPFTAECWFKTSDLRNQVLMEAVLQTGTNNGWYLSTTAAGVLNLNVRSGGSGSNIATGTTVVTDGRWHHVAVVRNGTSHVIWLDGEIEKSVTVTTANLSSTPVYFAVGAFVNTRSAASDFRGFITGVRITGGARYSKSFVAPRFGHPTIGYDYDHAWQNATMITLGFDTAVGGPNFWDEASGRAWRNQGNASITSARARYGGSAMLVTGSQHIYTLDSPELRWAGNPFTIEFSMYINSFTPNATVMCKGTGSSVTWSIFFDSTGKQLCYSNDAAGGTVVLTSPLVMAAGQWYDVVVSRDSVTLITDMRINGQLVVEAYSEITDYPLAVPLRIGGDPSSGGMVGYLDEVRITSFATSALARRYMGSSNVRDRRFPRGELPTDPLYLQTILMLHFDQAIAGSSFVDSSMLRQVPIVTTNCTLATTDGKFGPGCLSKTVAAGGLVYANNANMNMGLNDFTIELWIYRTSVGAQCTIFDTRPTSDSLLGVLGCNADDSFYWYSRGAFQITTSSGQSLVNTWQHITMCRSGSATTMYLNGIIMGGPFGDFLQSYNGAVFTIGNDVAGTTGFIGKMDEIRVTQGSTGGRYTGAFTPPQSRQLLNGYYEDPYQKNKVLSLHFDGADTGTVFTDQMNHVATRVGVPTTSQAWFVSGNASALFTGTDALTFDGNLPEFNLGAQEFTMRFWIRFVNLTGGNLKYIFSKSTTNTFYYSWRYAINENRRYVATFWNDFGTCICALESKTLASINSWNHFQTVRSGDTFMLFINGKMEASYTIPAAAATKKLYYIGSQKVVLGAQSDVANGVFAYIDELQLYVGTAINTKDFTPSTLPTPDV